MTIDKVCQICGKTFQVPHWREKAKYCSRKCSDESHFAEPNLICAICGKPFHRKPYHMKRCKGEFGLCCSRRCSSILRTKMMSGENNHQYGLRGHLNDGFKEGDIRRKNNKLNEILTYVGCWYEKPNYSGRIPQHRHLVELNHHLFDESFFECINGWYYLKDGLDVHHKDLNHDNNDLDNLQVLPKDEHRRLHCKIRSRKRDAKGQFIKEN